MEAEFVYSRTLDTQKKQAAKVKKSIVWLLAVLLSFQFLFCGIQLASPRTAEAATLGHNLVYAHAYGVRSDGIVFMSDDEGNQTVVNSAGKPTIAETDGYEFAQGWLDFDTCYGAWMNPVYMNGNIVMQKFSYPEIDDEDSWCIDISLKLVNPHNGQTIVGPIEGREYHGYNDASDTSWVTDAFIKACKEKGINTSNNVSIKQDELDTEMLPNGVRAYLGEYFDDNNQEGPHDYVYRGVVDKSGNQITIAGYQLGSKEEWDCYWNGVFRTNKQGKSMYYVTNSAGKVGAVEENGKVVIPFNYDDYFDAKAGSDLILLKKGNAWEFFDLNSVGYGSKSNQGNSSGNTGNNSSSNKPGNYQPGTTITQSGKWIKSGSRWWYRVSDGTYPANTVVNINKKTYRFDANGWMRTGWIKENGSWYYHNKSGAMQTGWLKTGGKWYYLNSDGKMQTTKKKIGNATYDFKSSGVMIKGWNKESDGWHYYSSSGAMKTGWLKSGGKWYYLNPKDGVMKTGWLDQGGHRYLLRPSTGAMITGWARADGKWYYFNKSGYMQKNKWVGNYYVDSDGKMLTSQWIGKYHVNSSGKWDATKK